MCIIDIFNTNSFSETVVLHQSGIPAQQENKGFKPELGLQISRYKLLKYLSFCKLQFYNEPFESDNFGSGNGMLKYREECISKRWLKMSDFKKEKEVNGYKSIELFQIAV